MFLKREEGGEREGDSKKETIKGREIRGRERGEVFNLLERQEFDLEITKSIQEVRSTLMYLVDLGSWLA